MTPSLAIDVVLVAGIYLGVGFVFVLLMWSVTEPLPKRLGAVLATGGIVAGVGAVLLTRDWTLPALAWVPLLFVLPLAGLAAEEVEKWWGSRHAESQ